MFLFLPCHEAQSDPNGAGPTKTRKRSGADSGLEWVQLRDAGTSGRVTDRPASITLLFATHAWLNI